MIYTYINNLSLGKHLVSWFEVGPLYFTRLLTSYPLDSIQVGVAIRGKMFGHRVFYESHILYVTDYFNKNPPLEACIAYPVPIALADVLHFDPEHEEVLDLAETSQSPTDLLIAFFPDGSYVYPTQNSGQNLWCNIM